MHKLFYVQILFHDDMYWSTIPIIAVSRHDALHCANHFGLVGIATEAVDLSDPIASIPIFAVDFDEPHEWFTDYNTTAELSPSFDVDQWIAEQRERVFGEWHWLTTFRVWDVVMVILVLILAYAALERLH